MILRIYIKIDKTGEMRVSSSSSANARSFFIIFFILTVAFSLTFTGIFRSNNAIGLAAYAKKKQQNVDNSSATDTRVITKDTTATDLTDGSPGTTVGTMFLGCERMVSKNDSTAASVKPACDSTIRYVIDYCVDHMTDNMAKQSSQI
jgi:hypothetical protein